MEGPLWTEVGGADLPGPSLGERLSSTERGAGSGFLTSVSWSSTRQQGYIPEAWPWLEVAQDRS